MTLQLSRRGFLKVLGVTAAVAALPAAIVAASSSRVTSGQYYLLSFSEHLFYEQTAGHLFRLPVAERAKLARHATYDAVNQLVWIKIPIRNTPRFIQESHPHLKEAPRPAGPESLMFMAQHALLCRDGEIKAIMKDRYANTRYSLEPSKTVPANMHLASTPLIYLVRTPSERGDAPTYAVEIYA